MSELERLDEALASHDRLAEKVRTRYPTAKPTLIPEVIIDAARAYRDLLANGQRVDVDALVGEVGLRLLRYERSGGTLTVERVTTTILNVFDGYELLSVYPKEADE